MTEENKPEETKEEAPNMVTSAMEAAEKLKAENEKMAAHIKELKELKAVDILGGRTESAPVPEETKEETPKEYVKRVMSGNI